MAPIFWHKRGLVVAVLKFKAVEIVAACCVQKEKVKKKELALGRKNFFRSQKSSCKSEIKSSTLRMFRATSELIAALIAV